MGESYASFEKKKKKKRIQVDGEAFYAHNAAFKMLYLLFLI